MLAPPQSIVCDQSAGSNDLRGPASWHPHRPHLQGGGHVTKEGGVNVSRRVQRKQLISSGLGGKSRVLRRTNRNPPMSHAVSSVIVIERLFTDQQFTSEAS